jgi:hypothetical protein
MSSSTANRKVEELDRLWAGPELVRRVAEVPIQELDTADRVRMMRAHQRLVAHYQAKLYQDMAAIWEEQKDDFPDEGFAIAVQEIRAALNLTRRAAESELNNAIDFWERLPHVGDLLKLGRIDIRRAKVFAHETGALPEHIAQVVVEQTSSDAHRMNGAQLRALLRWYCVTADPEHAHRAYTQAVEERRVVAEPEADGTARLTG